MAATVSPSRLQAAALRAAAEFVDLVGNAADAAGVTLSPWPHFFRDYSYVSVGVHPLADAHDERVALAGLSAVAEVLSLPLVICSDNPDTGALGLEVNTTVAGVKIRTSILVADPATVAAARRHLAQAVAA